MSVKTPHFITKSAVCYGLDVDDRTVSRYQGRENDPLPVSTQRRTKEGNQYDLRAVIEWAQRQALADISVGDDGQVYNYEAERARLTKAQADKTELEVSEKRGLVLNAETVRNTWSDLIASARAKLMALPTKVAAKAMSAKDYREAEDYVRAEIFAVLNDLADDNFDSGDQAGSAGTLAATA